MQDWYYDNLTDYGIAIPAIKYIYSDKLYLCDYKNLQVDSQLTQLLIRFAVCHDRQLARTIEWTVLSYCTVPITECRTDRNYLTDKFVKNRRLLDRLNLRCLIQNETERLHILEQTYKIEKM